MDNDLYIIMAELSKEKFTNGGDVKYLGEIPIKQSTANGEIVTLKNIFALVDIDDNTGLAMIRYYDERQNLIAGRSLDGRFAPSQQFVNADLKFLNTIDVMDDTQEVSLKRIDEALENVSKVLGIPKKDILSMSTVELMATSKMKESFKQTPKEDSKLTLATYADDEEEEQEEENKNVVEENEGKQEVDLDIMVNDKYTLAQVLNVSESAKLIVVSSSLVQGNEHSTRFSFVIQEADGSIRPAEMLKQVGGEHSDKNVYETNRDGSNIESKSIQSSFSIDSPLIENGILTIRQGQLGIIEVGYGQMDKTDHNNVFSQKLETREMYPITSRVREEFSKDKGTYNVSDKIDEIKEHENHNCSKMTIDEADGDPYTGHEHNENVAEIILSDEDVGDIFGDTYTKSEINERFESMRQKNPDADFDTLIEITKEELSIEVDYMHNPNERSH